MSCNIDIWHIKFDVSLSSSKYQSFYSLLDDNEKKRCDNFFNLELSVIFLTAHAYLRKILSYYSNNVVPQDWKFCYGAYGRPELAGEHNLPLRFNLTHTKQDAYYIVTNHYDCGIDLEEVRQDNFNLDKDIKNLVLAQKEQSQLQQLPLDLQQRAFFHYWTLKEAHIKALGTGFSTAPDQIEFILSERIIKSNQLCYFKTGQTKHYWTRYLARTQQILSFALFDVKEKPAVNFLTSALDRRSFNVTY